MGSDMRNIENLLSRITKLRQEPTLRTEYSDNHSELDLYSPISTEEVEGVERALGFRFPEIVRRCYLEIGNGGFGPGYGMIGVQIGAEEGHPESMCHSCNPDLYLGNREEQRPEGMDPWPDQLVPLFERGCGMFDCVDCVSPEAYIVSLEDNGGFVHTGTSLLDHMEQWVVNMEARAQQLGISL